MANPGGYEKSAPPAQETKAARRLRAIGEILAPYYNHWELWVIPLCAVIVLEGTIILTSRSLSSTKIERQIEELQNQVLRNMEVKSELNRLETRTDQIQKHVRRIETRLQAVEKKP